MGAYKTVLMTNLDGEDVQLEFDIMDDKKVNASSNVTTHPLATGDIVTDHMYRNPTNLSLSGTFSLAGIKRSTYRGTSDRLTNIEETFEKIKNEAIICKIVTVNEDDNKQTRFKIRDNMVLNNIRWNERQNSLDFGFDFSEVMLIDAFEQPYEVDITDDSLPALTDPRQLDFSDTLIDWNEVEKIVIQCCDKWGLMSKEFIEKNLPNIGKIVGASLVAAGVAVVLIAIGVACGASGPIGWIIGGVLAAAAVIGYCWYKLFKIVGNFFKQQKLRVKQFKYYKDDKKNKAECDRFVNFNSEIFKQIEQLENSVFLYGFNTNENQECTFYLDDEYYIFKFEKDSFGNYEMEMRDVNGKVLIPTTKLTGLTNIADCNSSNAIYRTAGVGSYIYVMNPSLYEDEEVTLTDAERDAYTKDLTKYMIMVTTIKMENFANMMIDIIKNAVMY